MCSIVQPATVRVAATVGMDHSKQKLACMAANGNSLTLTLQQERVLESPLTIERTVHQFSAVGHESAKMYSVRSLRHNRSISTAGSELPSCTQVHASPLTP